LNFLVGGDQHYALSRDLSRGLTDATLGGLWDMGTSSEKATHRSKKDSEVRSIIVLLKSRKVSVSLLVSG
jgi:hypothetical protein